MNIDWYEYISTTQVLYTQYEYIRNTQVVYTQGYMSTHVSYTHMNILTTQVKYIQEYMNYTSLIYSYE